MEYFSITYHALLLAYYSFVLKYVSEMDFTECINPIVRQMGEYRTRYLTSWNMIIQVVFLILALSVDILNVYPDRFSEYRKTLNLFKGYFITSVLFPFGTFVFTAFWTVYCMNREWVLPASTDPFFPLWINHTVHTIIVIPPIVEILTTNQFIPSFKAGLIGVNIISWPYCALMFYTYYKNGIWLYGLFNAVKFHEVGVLLALNYLHTIALMRLGIFLQHLKRQYNGQIRVKCKSPKSEKGL